MSVTKTELKKQLVAERKKMREKAKQSAFLRKTANVYRAMVKRAAECKQSVDFTLEQMREFVKVLPKECVYCFEPLTPSNWTLDHYHPVSRGGDFKFGNLYGACKSCNWQKGQLTGAEFEQLQSTLNKFAPLAAADVRRRLTIGGKWSFGK